MSSGAYMTTAEEGCWGTIKASCAWGPPCQLSGSMGLSRMLLKAGSCGAASCVITCSGLAIAALAAADRDSTMQPGLPGAGLAISTPQCALGTPIRAVAASQVSAGSSRSALVQGTAGVWPQPLQEGWHHCAGGCCPDGEHSQSWSAQSARAALPAAPPRSVACVEALRTQSSLAGSDRVACSIQACSALAGSTGMLIIVLHPSAQHCQDCISRRACMWHQRGFLAQPAAVSAHGSEVLKSYSMAG